MTGREFDRRQAVALGLGVAGAAAVPVPALAQVSAARDAPAIDHNLPDVVVIGAGAFGGWTALSLRERGARVTLVDAYGPGNPHASSGGESRNIQFAYAIARSTRAGQRRRGMRGTAARTNSAAACSIRAAACACGRRPCSTPTRRCSIG